MRCERYLIIWRPELGGDRDELVSSLFGGLPDLVPPPLVAFGVGQPLSASRIRNLYLKIVFYNVLIFTTFYGLKVIHLDLLCPFTPTMSTCNR